MRGSSHEALGLATSYAGLKVFTDTPMDTRALPLAAVSLGVLMLWEAMATQRQKRDVRRAGEWQADMLAKGLSPAHVEGLKKTGHGPSVRWHGPPRRLSRPLRLIAIVAAFTVAIPVGVALASSRLPDLLEIGPIPHRGPTHWLLTAAALITAAVCAGINPAITLGFAIGYLCHLAADGLTLSGVPFLWPFIRDDLHLLPRPMRIRMGSPVDTLLALGVLAAMVLSLAPHDTTALADHVCKHHHTKPVTHTHKHCHHGTTKPR